MIDSKRNEAIETYKRLIVIVWVDFDFKDVARLLGVVFVDCLRVDAESDFETPSVYQSVESDDYTVISNVVLFETFCLEHLLGRVVLCDAVGRCQDFCRAIQ